MLQPKLAKVVPQKPSYLELFYITGEKKKFDVSPYIFGQWYSELENWEYFKAVSLTEDHNGIEWPHGQDIAPHELYEQSVLIG